MKIEPNHLYLGDCLELMPHIEDASIDMIMCDLPYGTTACSWDTIILLEPLWKQYKRIIKDNGAIILTASQPFTTKLISSNLEMFKYCMVWIKSLASNFFNANRQPLKKHEDICVFYRKQTTYNPQKEKRDYAYTDKRKGISKQCKQYYNTLSIPQNNEGWFYPTTIIEIDNPNGNNISPTQKPVALFEYLIKTYTNEGDLVLDNCIGSGTTAIAALNTNRRYIGMEKEQGDYDKALYRINHRQTKLT